MLVLQSAVYQLGCQLMSPFPCWRRSSSCIAGSFFCFYLYFFIFFLFVVLILFFGLIIFPLSISHAD